MHFYQNSRILKAANIGDGMSEKVFQVAEDIAATDLTEILQKNGHDVEVKGFEHEPIGTGQVASSERLTLEYASHDGKAPETLAVKFPANNPDSAMAAAVSGLYRREALLYRELSGDLRARIPKAYDVRLSEKGDSFTLFMEDMAPAKQGDQLTGCSLEVAKNCLTEAAKMHASYWQNDKLDKLDWLIGSEAARARTDLLVVDNAVFNHFWNEFKTRYADRLEPREEKAGDWLCQHYEGYTDIYDGPKTLTHTDYRSDNLLLGDGTSAPLVTIVDWQTPGFAAPAGDISYFIGTSISVEDRRKHEKELLEHYLQTLNSEGVSSYDYDALLHHYKLTAFSGFIMAVIAAIQVVRTERGDDMFFAMLTRPSALIEDYDIMALIEAEAK